LKISRKYFWYLSRPEAPACAGRGAATLVAAEKGSIRGDILRATLLSGLFSAIVVPALLLTACGTAQIVARARIPPPLIEKLPMTVGWHVPAEFASYVHKEKHGSNSGKLEAALGKGQTEVMTQLVRAMFEKVVPVDSVGPQADASIRAILEPSIDEYSFITPQEAGADLYAVSIKYRITVYGADGKLIDSWPFTGYGSVPAAGLKQGPSIERATSLALRDAAAKLASEFPEQDAVKNLRVGSELEHAP